MASLDYYQLLGISRKAAAREVRRAYRALARKYHPDFNPGDEATTQKFREIQEAYEVLGNSQKRKAYGYYGPNFGQRIPTRNVPATETNAVPVDRPSGFPHFASSAAPTTDSLRSGRLSPRARAALGRAAIAAILLGGALLYFSWPKAGVREFTRAREALRQVKSWKMEYRGTGANSFDAQYSDEVSCPSGERLTQHTRYAAAGRTVEHTLETVIIGNYRYMRADQAKAWIRDWVGTAGPTNTCAKLSRGEDSAEFPPLAEWLAGGGHNIAKENLTN